MKYFSTFTGIGGLDWGLEVLGAQCVGFSEIKESSIQIYKKHFPDHKNFGDLTKIDFAALPDFDVLTGGFPCQSFSLAGQRAGFSDKRGKMIFYLAELLEKKQPQFAVFENVRGIVAHDKGRTYRNVFRLLWSVGYYVRVVLLNAWDHGSCQNREWILFLCSKTDFPRKAPVITDQTKVFRDIRQPVGTAFDFVKMNDIMEKRIEGRYHKCWVLRGLGGYDRLPTLLTARYGSFRRPVITQEPDRRWRYLSIIEAERAQGFPDNFTEGVKDVDRWFAVGNAVCRNVSEYLFAQYLKGLWW